MRFKYNFSIAMFVTAAFTSTSALSSDCWSDIKYANGAIVKIINCLKEINSENDKLRENLKKLEELLNNVIPNNIIVASISECTKLGPRWENYEHATGRIIIGAGEHNEKSKATSAYAWWRYDNIIPSDTNKFPIKGYKVEQYGGEENHLLTVPEMPRHKHDFIGKTVTRGGNNGIGKVVAIGDAAQYGKYTPEGELSETGSNKSHNILPPYIALYFCKHH